VVIAQILTEEPARPRQLRPALPRVLETIILTCLAKEPAFSAFLFSVSRNIDFAVDNTYLRAPQ
jgi:hypothetical protein